MKPVTQLGRFYAVTPGGEDGPEHFEATLRGLTGKRGAMQCAIGLSAGGRVQRITKTDGRATRVIREYLDGRETFRSGAEILPAVTGPAPSPPLQLAAEIPVGRKIQSRRRRKTEQASWPGIIDPPCTRA
jgi:hypothetical protein